jgi:hypothetical protein
LLVDGRDRMVLVERVEAQVGYTRGVLEMTDYSGLDVRGALCFPDVNGLPVFSTLRLRNVMIDGPKRVAKLARWPGPPTPEALIACGATSAAASRRPDRGVVSRARGVALRTQKAWKGDQSSVVLRVAVPCLQESFEP